MAIPIEFLLFAAILAGIAFLHRHALVITLCGLGVLLFYKFIFGFAEGTGFHGLVAFADSEWITLVELLLLLTGFSILSNQFERSRLPDAMPNILPDDWTGGLVLLALVFVTSAFLDNIAAAVIGGVIARHVYRGHVTVGFLAAIVAASNAGGSGSVIGDTTTTLLWLAGVSPWDVLPAYVGALASFAVFGVFGARAQHRAYPIEKSSAGNIAVDFVRLAIVAFMLFAIVGANVAGHFFFPTLHEYIPVLGTALWIAILLTAPIRAPPWYTLKSASKGAVFLVALVTCAALMPVEALPSPSWHTTLGLGIVSAVFDNIPLTEMAIKQGGYDWSLLAYSVGFGGSMIWFGSSAGVAISATFPRARSVFVWLREGWFVPLAFAVGFFVKLALLGWHPALPG